MTAREAMARFPGKTTSKSVAERTYDGAAHWGGAGALRLARIEYLPVRLPLAREIAWASLRESAAEFMILRLTTENGLTGIAEGSIKLRWTGASLRSLAVVIDELFAPRLRGVDLADEAAMKEVLKVPREHGLAKAMIDMAVWDIRAQAAGQPLWKLWGGLPEVPVSWVVTRQTPLAMAQEAETMVARHGFGTLKVKGGQGLETDLAALTEIRRAVGTGITLYVDPNGAYTAAETPAYLTALAERGVIMVEDPCPLEPTSNFAALQAACPIPILVDGACRNLLAAKLFLERGARAVSIKTQKAAGFTENRAIIAAAEAAGCMVHVGLLAETSLGALAALQLQAAIPSPVARLPSETTFHLQLPQEFMHEPLAVQSGRIRLPETAGFAQLVDWDRIRRLAP